jgi:hypothetical protein
MAARENFWNFTKEDLENIFYSLPETEPLPTANVKDMRSGCRREFKSNDRPNSEITHSNPVVRHRGRSIPTLASISKWLIEDKLKSLAGPVCMKLCME